MLVKWGTAVNGGQGICNESNNHGDKACRCVSGYLLFHEFHIVSWPYAIAAYGCQFLPDKLHVSWSRPLAGEVEYNISSCVTQQSDFRCCVTQWLPLVVLRYFENIQSIDVIWANWYHAGPVWLVPGNLNVSWEGACFYHSMMD